MNRVVLPIHLVLFVIVIAVCSSCGDADKKQQRQVVATMIPYEQEDSLLLYCREHIHQDIELVLTGEFDGVNGLDVVTGRMVNKKGQIGVVFAFHTTTDTSMQQYYETDVLEGILSEAEVQPFSLATTGYDYLHYNTGAYFLGSGSGEIFTYLVDVPRKQIYSAHLVVNPDKEITLEISPNTNDMSLHSYFEMSFRRDYPELKIIESGKNPT